MVVMLTIDRGRCPPIIAKNGNPYMFPILSDWDERRQEFFEGDIVAFMEDDPNYSFVYFVRHFWVVR